MDLTGKRIAVYGLGRSGTAVIEAALRRGAIVSAFDQEPDDSSSVTSARDRFMPRGATVTGGRIEPLTPPEADWLVTSPGVPMRSPTLQGTVAAGVEVLSEVEFAYRLSSAPIIAITGTNGKSTTTVMCWNCLKEAGFDALLCGNLAGSGYEERTLTEATDTATENQWLVAEVSSFQLEWVRDFKPLAAAITNISEDHLNRYSGIGEYVSTKHRIFNRQDSACVSVVPADHPEVVWQPFPGGPLILTCGIGGRDAHPETDGLKLDGCHIRSSELPFSEPHNYANAQMAYLLAYGALLQRGIDAAEPLLQGLRSFRGLAHRMEMLGERDGVQFINNSMCTNPWAVVTSSVGVRRRQHLLIGGVNKEASFEPLKIYLKRSKHAAYLFGRDRDAIQEEMQMDLPSFETMDEAFAAAAKAAKSGETVMLAPGCASQDQFQDFQDRGNVFREMVRRWIDR